MKFEKIYKYLPIYLQNTACSLYGWKENKLRFNKDFLSILADYKMSEFYNEARIESNKKSDLNKVLTNAFKFVPYYRDVFEKLNIEPSDITCFDDLKKLPVLSKEDLRLNQDKLLSNQYETSELREVHTSGTTGKALTLFKHPLSITKQWAVWYRHRARFNSKVGDLHVNFTGKQVVPTSQIKPPYWRYNSASNQFLINMQHITDSKIKDIIAFLNTIQPKFYSGYPSIISEVARLGLEHNLALKDECKPEYIFCGAENTLDYQKYAMQEWAGATITDQYGLTEGSCNMSRCEYGYYHEDFEFCHIECVDPEILPSGRKRGRLVGTSFSNPAMPLIRYDTGDIAIWAPDDYQCQCGRKSSVIESVEGRIDDTIKLVDGRRIMRFDYLFKGTDSIKEAQVCQYKEGEVVIEIVMRVGFSTDIEEELKRSFSQWICKDTKVLIKQVDAIEKSSSGKFRAVKSYL